MQFTDIQKAEAIQRLILDHDYTFEQAYERITSVSTPNPINVFDLGIDFPTVNDDICIDLETLGTEADSAILTIGAAVFNRFDNPGSIKATFERKIDITLPPSRAMSGATLMWWMGDSMDSARKAAFDPRGRVRLGVALKDLADFIRQYDVNEVFACGPDFDCKMLDNAYKQHNQPGIPVPFYRWGCVRTLEKAFYGKNTRKPGGVNHLGGTAHDAIDDVKMEINVIQKTLQAAYSCALED